MSDQNPTTDGGLASAEERVNERLRADSKFPTLTELLHTSSSSEYSQANPASWQIVTKQRSIALPDALFEQYDLLECRCFMGLFPEIQRAWITVDHRLFLWNYEDESDFYSFEDQEQIIVSVALVKPKPGVFIDSIKYVLAVATPLEVFLLGIKYEEAGRGGSVSLFATQISVPADSVAMTSMVGTEAGRIFMAGNDGGLYEFEYQAEDSWLRRRSKKVNLTASVGSYFLPSFWHMHREKPALSMAVDNERHLLYVLLQDASIKVFWLGHNGGEFVLAHHHKTVGNAAALLCPQINEGRELEVVSMHVIPTSESRAIHLVAVTAGGSRLYFSTLPRVQWYSANVQMPAVFDLVHVRLPPDSRPVAMQLPHLRAPTLSVHCSLYSHGTVLLAHELNDDHDAILAGAPDCALALRRQVTQPRQILCEFAAESRIEGRTWAMAELAGDENTNDLATVSGIPTRHFAVLTNAGVSVLAKQRPVDMFRALITQPALPEAQLKQFVDTFGLAEVCAMCFTILCTDDFTQTSAQAVTAARRMLFEFGGIPRYAETKLLFETPTAPTVPLSEQPAAQRKIELSGRHDGLVIYVSRILQPVWQELATVLRKDAMNKHHVEIGIGAGRLLGVQQRLQRLQHFLTTNQRFVPDQINQLAESLQQTPEGNVSACWQAEAQSLASLYDLVVLAIETISLLSLIQDFDLPRISAEAMSSEKRSELSDLKFHTLVCTKGGREACRALIVAVINAQIKQHSSIASISDALRLRCASIFSAQDVSLYKAMELLNLASEASEPAEQRELANNALELLRDISGTLILDNVRYVFGRFVKLNMRAQAVDLALMCAKGVDPKDQALAFWRDRAPANDKRQELYEFRTSCYQLVLDDLAETANVSALRLLPTDDALFCFRLYDWLLDRGQTTTLYELGGPLLEEYFAVADQRDMLWHLYVHEGRFAMAAVVQRDLACQPGDLKLARRIEYLSLAISNVKIAIDQMDKDDEASDQLARVLRETEDMLEVAQTQMELQRLAQSHTEVAKRLDRQLYDVSALYQDFAEPLQLPEAKLLIFKVSCHDDPEQVTEVWEELLRSTLSDPLRTGLMAVAAKISELVPRLLPSSSAVPVNGLVAVLVRLASERPAEYVPGYICDSLVLAGVPYQAVFESLVRVHRKLAGDPSLAEMLVREVVYLAGAWLANAGEDVPTMYVDEVISQYIVQANVAKNQALQSDLLKAQEKVRQVL